MNRSKLNQEDLSKAFIDELVDCFIGCLKVCFSESTVLIAKDQREYVLGFVTEIWERLNIINPDVCKVATRREDAGGFMLSNMSYVYLEEVTPDNIDTLVFNNPVPAAIAVSPTLRIAMATNPEFDKKMKALIRKTKKAIENAE
jgi:hypothetical protein